MDYSGSNNIFVGPILADCVNNAFIFFRGSSYLLSLAEPQVVNGYVDKTTLKWASKTYASRYSRYPIQDNLNETMFYGLYGYSALNVINAPFNSDSVVDDYTTYNLPGEILSNGIINLGTLSYIGGLTNIYHMVIIKKQDFTFERTPNYYLNSNHRVRTVCSNIDGYMANNRQYLFGLFITGSWYLVDFYMITDLWEIIDNGICKKCPTGMYMNNNRLYNYWLLYADIQAGYGINPVTNFIEKCELGCNAWKDNSKVWTTWNLGGGYFRDPNTGQCYKRYQIPDLVGLFNTGTELLREWTVANWLRCPISYTVWLAWKPGFAIDEISLTCKSTTETVGYGIDPFNKFALRPCKITNCIGCSSDIFKCEQWSPGNRVSQIDYEWYPEDAGRYVGKNPDFPYILSKWTDVNCRFCSDLYTTCTTCKKGYLVNNTLSTWVVNTTSVPGYGLDATTNLVLKKWTDFNWSDCFADYTTCKTCKLYYGFEDGICVIMPVEITIQLVNNTDGLYNVSTSLIMTLKENPLDTEKEKTLKGFIHYLELKPEILSPLFYTPSGELETVAVNYELTSNYPTTYVNFKNKISLTEVGTYVMHYYRSSIYEYFANGRVYWIKPYNITFDYDNFITISQIKAAEAAGEVTSVFIGSWAPNKGASAAVNIIAGVDPTGITTYFFQCLKLYSKLKYLNLNYGILLNTFLWNIMDPTIFVVDEPLDTHAKHSKNTRFNLSSGKVPLQFDAVLVDKLMLYYFTWTLKILHIFVFSWFLGSFWKHYDKVVYWVFRIHFVFFNLAFVDFFFFGTRAMYQSKNLTSATIIGYCTMQLMLFDILYILKAVNDDKLWLIMYQRLNFALNFKKLRENPVELANNAKIEEMASKKGSDYNTIIGTYIIFFAALPLKINKAIFMNKLARIRSLLYISRMSIYMMLIISSQISTGFILLILFGIELALCAFNIRLFIEVRHLANIGFMIIPALSNVAMIIYFFLCIVTSLSNEMSEVGKGQQYFWIYLIYIALIWEYAMLVINAVLAIIYYVKLRIVRRQQGVPSASPAKLITPYQKLESQGSKMKELENKDGGANPNNYAPGSSFVNSQDQNRGRPNINQGNFSPPVQQGTISSGPNNRSINPVSYNQGAYNRNTGPQNNLNKVNPVGGTLLNIVRGNPTNQANRGGSNYGLDSPQKGNPRASINNFGNNNGRPGANNNNINRPIVGGNLPQNRVNNNFGAPERDARIASTGQRITADPVLNDEHDDDRFGNDATVSRQSNGTPGIPFARPGQQPVNKRPMNVPSLTIGNNLGKSEEDHL